LEQPSHELCSRIVLVLVLVLEDRARERNSRAARGAGILPVTHKLEACATSPVAHMDAQIQRMRGVIRGAVQGVGFRPFVYRLATELGLKGWVLNSAQGVFVEVEGRRQVLDQFLLALDLSRPPRAVVQSSEFSLLDALGYKDFEIKYSQDQGTKSVLILPDIATCKDCLREMLDPLDRRYRYPFTNCTNCGPRFSILEALPYDRPNTSMKHFALCRDCLREYGDPRNRRFHAQPTACPRCGPQLALWDKHGVCCAERDRALRMASEALRAGKVVTIKGIGGFQLMVDARNEAAVALVRARKRREEKPFALMYPDLSSVRQDCQISELEQRLLLSPEAPIVLLTARRRYSGSQLAPSVAPKNPDLGVMLPYSPLHHLLLGELSFPVVATSGNLSDEPICTDEHEAVTRLAGIADFLLVHDRPIVRPIDDSVMRIVAGRELMLRRARGYAPLPVRLTAPLPSVLAVGAHLKNTIALSVGQEVFISQHIGDLATAEAHSAFRRVVADLPRLYDVQLEAVACDNHPEYLSTKYAANLGLRQIGVQHHWAHVLACLAENDLSLPVLGISWDGTGLGSDGTIWGGEFLRSGEHLDCFERVGHLRQFRLPGAEAAIKQPCRAACGLLFAIWGEAALGREDLAPIRALPKKERTVVGQMLTRKIRAPLTSSAGRLFDAIASLLGLRDRVGFEGQAAMALEHCLMPGIDDAYSFDVKRGTPLIVDWEPTLMEILRDLERGENAGKISARFHNTLAEMILAVARVVDVPRVLLTGGCFQNRYLTERCVNRLTAASFRPYWHQRVPPNDGGIALGQVIGAAARMKANEKQGQCSLHESSLW
jgi:hydrogenase maturation protein HypF